MYDVESMLHFIMEQLDNTMDNGCYSVGFACDLAIAAIHGHYNVSAIIEEVAILEGTSKRRSQCKPAKMLKGAAFKGYWHKHHPQARFMPNNLRNELSRDKTVHRVLGLMIGQTLTADAIGRLSHELVLGNYTRRMQEGRLTGEWIVFAKRVGRNCYLTLATHSEVRSDDAQKELLERLDRHQKAVRTVGSVLNAGVHSSFGRMSRGFGACA